MPRTKREGIFYGVVMAFTMSLFMNLFNTFLHAGVNSVYGDRYVAGDELDRVGISKYNAG